MLLKTSPGSKTKNSFSAALRITLIVVVYLAGYILLDLASSVFEFSPGVSVWYLPPAWSLALLVLFGIRYLPVHFMGVLISGLIIPGFTIPLPVLLLLALVNSGGYGIAAQVIRNICKIDLVRMSRPITIRYNLMVLGTSVIVAFLSLAVLNITGTEGFGWSGYPLAALNFALSDLFGLLSLTPFLLVILFPWLRSLKHKISHEASLQGKLLTVFHAFPARKELVFCLSQILVIFVILVFTSYFQITRDIHLDYLCFVPLVWLSFRYGFRGAVGSILIVNLILMLLTQFTQFQVANLIEMQIFLLVLSIVGLLLGTEVSEHKRAEDDLLIKNFAIDSAIPAIAFASLAGMVTYVNSSFLKLWGYADDREVLGRPAVSFWMTEQKAEEVIGVLYADHQWSGELIARRKNGSTFTVELIAGLIRDPDGEPVCMMGSFVDVTDQRQSILALQNSEEKYRLLFENATDAIMIFDTETLEILEANQVAVERSGYSLSEFLKLKITDIDPDFACVYEGGIDIQDNISDTNKLTEHVHLCKDGSEILVETNSRLIKYNGRMAIQSIVRDITERRRTEKILIESQRLAELGTLAAGMAHEINSPLQVITGLSETVRDKLRNGSFELPYLHSALDRINNNAWRVAHIVRSLLTYASTTIDEVEQHPINEIVEDCLLLLEYKLSSSKKIFINKYLDENLPEIYCERNHISQVVMNILSNALDAVSDGGEVSIYTQPGQERQGVVLLIEDSGIGMDEQSASRIFDPFYTTKPLGEGTGLGMSIALGIIKSHGGKIDIKSEPGEGTCVEVFLPLVPPKNRLKEFGGRGRFDNLM